MRISSVRAASNQATPLHAAPRQPHRLQHRREPQREFDIGMFATPRKRRPQVLDLDFGLLDRAAIVSTRSPLPNCRLALRTPLAASREAGHVQSHHRRRGHHRKRDRNITPSNTSPRSMSATTVRDDAGSGVAGGFLGELHARSQAELGVDVGEVGLHGAR
jgi:hypothetical protein